jgi:hypothetical protein
VYRPGYYHAHACSWYIAHADVKQSVHEHEFTNVFVYICKVSCLVEIFSQYLLHAYMHSYKRICHDCMRVSVC